VRSDYRNRVIHAALRVEPERLERGPKPPISLPRVAWMEKRLPYWDDPPEPRLRRAGSRPFHTNRADPADSALNPTST